METVMKSITLLMLITATIAKPTQVNCGNKPADVVFVLDASSSIWEPNFVKQMDFVNNVVDLLDVGSDVNQTRIGVLTFSDYSSVRFHLDSFLDAESIIRAVGKIPYQTGGTNTSDALLTARLQMFSPSHSPRPEAVRIAVVLTDGQSEDTEATYREAMALKAAGVQVFAIGVGFFLDENELKVVASTPSEQFVFTVEEYDALDSLKKTLAIRACEVTLMSTPVPTEPATTPPTVPSSETPTAAPSKTVTSSSTAVVFTTTEPASTPSPVPSTETSTAAPSKTVISFSTDVVFTTTESTTADVNVESQTSPLGKMISPPSGILGEEPARPARYPKVCQGKPAEVFFLLDSSSSIIKEDFQKQSLFIQHVVELFDLGDSKTRVGLSTFSDKVYPMLNLGGYTSKRDLIQIVDQIPYLSGGTNTGEALRDMRERGMAPEVIRREVAHVAIVLTDGQSRDPQVTAAQAKAAKGQGLYVFAIGIGDSVDMLELEDIASKPSSRFVFHVTDYAALESIKDILAIRACEVDPSNVLGDKSACPEVPTDVIFMYDSGKMGSDKSAEVSNLITRTISVLPMSEESFKFGVLADTCPKGDGHVALTSERISLTSSLVQDNVRDLSTLFYDLRTEAFKTKTGDRQSSRKLAVVFLDDKLANYDKIVAHAKRSKSLGIEILVVATSDQVPFDDIKAIASQPLNSNYLRLHKLESPESSQLLADFLCGEGFTLDEIEAE